jgi:hypothetical protein
VVKLRRRELVAMTQVHEWRGASGRRYCFRVAPLDSAAPPMQPGVFIYCRQDGPGWVPVALGHVDDLAAEHRSGSTRFVATQAGATHLHLHVRLAGAEDRVEEEVDLAESFGL